MDDFLTFLIVLIFFIGPALRKLFEGQEAKNAPRRNRSREEVKKYLERMRALQEQSASAAYQEPEVVEEPQATTTTFEKVGGDRFSSFGENDNFNRIAQAVEHDVTEHVNNHISELNSSVGAVNDNAIEKNISKSKKARLEELILENERLNDLQRAFVLSEIFNKPKSLTQDI